MSQSNPRQEIVFTIEGETYRHRPTFGVLAQIEAGHGPVFDLLGRMASGKLGVAETAKIVHTILGGPQRGGPKLGLVQQEVMDNYAKMLLLVTDFLTESVNGRKQPGEDDDEGSAEGNGRRAAH